MYNGDERLVCDGAYLQYSMLDFWKWAYSNIRYNMQRGTFADFLVRCALDSGGIATRSEIGTGFEPYDLEGPIIPSTGELSRIEVKSAGAIQDWGKTTRIAFSIAPARLPEGCDIKHAAPQQRNNDLYVFALYEAMSPNANILDLYWWKFYVLATYRINSDRRLNKQKTISIKNVESLCQPVKFDGLCQAIVDVCNSIPAPESPESVPE